MRKKIVTTEDLLSNVAYEPNSGCWLWLGSDNNKGYGIECYGGKVNYVHREIYKALVGPIADGMEIDHLCRVPACCNPEHLRQVTHAENMRAIRDRGVYSDRKFGSTVAEVGSCKVKFEQTHCKRGHEMTPDNRYAGNGACVKCTRLRALAHREKKKLQAYS